MRLSAHKVSRQFDWKTPRTPFSATLFESAGNGMAAKSTLSIFQIPLPKLIPVALDQQFAATRAPSAAAFAVMDVSGVNVVQTLRPRDLACAGKRCRRCMRFIEHLEVGMKCREMPRYIRPEVFRKPLACAMQLSVAVVLARNKQRRDFEPDVRFISEMFQRIEHGTELGKTKPVIKGVCECFKIDIRRIHVPVKLRAGVIGNVAGSDGDRLDSTLAPSLCHIDRVLGEDNRIIVGECDRSTAESLRCQRDLLRRCRVGQLIPFARFGNVPVLAKSAPKITSRCSE